MMNFFGFNESGAFSGSSQSYFYISHDSRLEQRLAELDPDTRKQVKKRLGDFHSEEEMELFINQIKANGGRSFT